MDPSGARTTAPTGVVLAQKLSQANASARHQTTRTQSVSFIGPQLGIWTSRPRSRRLSRVTVSWETSSNHRAADILARTSLAAFCVRSTLDCR